MDKYFRFKQFKVGHDRCTMKVGTDGVLLGAWINTEGMRNVLDIGTGSGVMALMMAQRTNANVVIDGVESGSEDAAQARENVKDSPWPGRVNIYQQNIQDFHPEKKYDLIISNPPFFSDSFLPLSFQRGEVRHTLSLTHADLLLGVKRLLSPDGTFALILPVVEGTRFIHAAGQLGLFPHRSLAFFSREKRPQERWLFEFSAGRQPLQAEMLILHGPGNEWSDAYKALTQDFYLNI